jgi:hypothetical protein
MAVALNAYYGITVSLADTNAHNLYDLLVAIDASLAGLYQNVGRLSLQADASNGANTVYVGDASVASTRKAFELLVHDQVPMSKEAMNVPVKGIYLRASGATCKVNVELQP